jgi:hypothetical protein
MKKAKVALFTAGLSAMGLGCLGILVGAGYCPDLTEAAAKFAMVSMFVTAFLPLPARSV